MRMMTSTLVLLAVGVALVIGGADLSHVQAQTETSTPTTTSTPTAIPLPTALPTLLPDQTLASLTTHSQAVAQLGTKPAGIGIIALLFLWLGLFWLLRQQRM